MSDKISSNIVLNGFSAELLSTTGEPIGTPILKYPFLKDGDTDTKIIERRYWLYANVRSVPQINSALDEATASLFDFETNDMFLCEESEPTDVGCGIVEITRTFANVPKTRNVRMPQAITMFGIETNTTEVEEDITSQCNITHSLDSATITYPEKAIGRRVRLRVKSTDPDFTFHRWIFLTPTKTTETYDRSFIGYSRYNKTDGTTIVYMHHIDLVEIMVGLPIRNSKSTIVDGYITFKYVKMNDAFDKIILPTPFEEANGEIILTNATSPTIAEYSKMVERGDSYQCAPATISMWLGNIAEIQIPYVYAM